MALQVSDIDWQNGIINIPKDELTLVQSSPSFVYDYFLPDLWKDLRTLEDTETGRVWPIMLEYNQPQNVAGTELAAVLRISDYYTITFEDGQYAVNLKGMNANVADRTNVNQVSVRPQNSAGLANSQAIEFGEYDGKVTIDQGNLTGSAVSGTSYPTGTLRRPVDNIADARLIDSFRGFGTISVIGALVLDTGDDVTNMHLKGQNVARTTITLNADANTLSCEISEAYVTGNLDGGTILRNCILDSLNYINGLVYNCMLEANTTITLGGSNPAHFLNCYSGTPGLGTAIIDCNGVTDDQDTPLAFRAYSGGLKLVDLTGGAHVSLDFISGQVRLDHSCTNGTVVIRGNATVWTNTVGSPDTWVEMVNSGTINGGLVVHNEAPPVSAADIADAIGETGSGLTEEQITWLKDLWQINGLDPSNPMTVTHNSRIAGDVSQTISGDGVTTSTVSRI